MPTVLRVGSYRFFFYAGDADEPPHIHVGRDGNVAKFWLDPVRLVSAGRFPRAELHDIERWSPRMRRIVWRRGVAFSTADIPTSYATGVSVTDDTLSVDLADGRTISAPIAWFPRLAHGTPAERRNLHLIGGGEGIHWPDLDEDISVEGLLAGRRSGESQASLKRWLASRQHDGR